MTGSKYPKVIGLLSLDLHRENAKSVTQVSPSRIARVELSMPRIDAMAWLRAQPSDAVKTYWSDRDGQEEVAGVGVASLLTGEGPNGVSSLWDRLGYLLGETTAARYFGGMRFNGQSSAGTGWRAFGSYQFVLPRFELSSCGSRSVFACQWLRWTTELETVLEDSEGMAFPGAEIGCSFPVVRDRRDIPDTSAWEAAVTRTLQLISEGALEKVVLARKSTFDFAAELDPLACLQALLPEAERCYRFCFVPAKGRAFLGVSPERLYRRDGRRISCDAIAGTRSRGDGVSLDQMLERDLVGSEKERREQEYVVRGIQESLTPLCRSLVNGGDPSVVKLHQCQHLMTNFEGTLCDDVADAELLKALHPTPAVGGYPTDHAVREIQEREPFDRGWYAGPVGWVGHDRAEFAVAIRSGLVEGSTLSVFSGAGIVDGSVPADEWEELDYKIRHFTQALNLPR